ncbi:malate dehydrogenase [Burkholderia sp. Bp9126]|nr:malate dehydrogenase [Burkholderia sp. Bp9126]
MFSSTKRVVIANAVSNVGYSMLFRIAKGELFGGDVKVTLKLLESPSRLAVLRATVAMLLTSDVRALQSVEITADPDSAFSDADYALLLNDKNFGCEAERSRQLMACARTYSCYGRALNEKADRDVKIVVANGAANTCAWIVRCFTPDLPDGAVTAVIRNNHNHVISQLAALFAVPVDVITRICVWGNHEATVHPDLRFAYVGNQPVRELLAHRQHSNPITPDMFTGICQNLCIESSVQAILDHSRDWARGSNDRWVSMIVPSDGSYGVPPGLMFGMPVVCSGGSYQHVRTLELDVVARHRINSAVSELLTETRVVRQGFNTRYARRPDNAYLYGN